MRRGGGRQRRQLGERVGFGFAVHARGSCIKNEQNAPGLREVGAHQDGGRPVIRAAAAVDDEAAGREGRHADGGAGAAVEKTAELVDAALTAFERHHGGGGRERELGAGAEPGMRWDGAHDFRVIGAGQRIGLGQALQRGKCALVIGSLGVEVAGAGEDELGRRLVDGEPDAAEAAPQIAVEVEEAQVQAGGCDHAHGAGRPAALGGWRSPRGVL